MDAASKSKAFKNHAVLNKIEADKYIRKADFVHMVDANDYNYFVSTLLDVLNPEDIDSAFRQQSYVKNIAKGFTQAVKHKDNAYKALDVFSDADSVTAINSNRIVKELQENKKMLNEFFKDNKSIKEVPIILVQNKTGAPEIHK